MTAALAVRVRDDEAEARRAFALLLIASVKAGAKPATDPPLPARPRLRVVASR